MPVIKAKQGETREKVRELLSKHLAYDEIAKQLGITNGSVYYHMQNLKNGKNGNKPDKHQLDKVMGNVLRLKESGLNVPQIAAKLKISKSIVNYNLYQRSKRFKEENNEQHPTYSSNSSATGVHRDVLIGIAFSEVNRFIGLLGERLGVPATILGSRLAKLLGHPPLRG
jgi:DNA-binding CsgD family transcriptional regulator